MNSIGKLFLKGLAVVIPAVLTLAILWWMAAGAERMLGGLLKYSLPEGWYVPGMGLLVALAMIALVGLLSHVLVFQVLFEFWERVVARVPLAKTIYSAIKDFVGYFGSNDKDRFNKVVLVSLPNQSAQLLGFITRESFEDIPLKPDAEDPVAVYLPMSYQIGGYTLFVARSSLTPVDMSFEQAMRLTVTGGVTQSSNDTD